MRTSKVRLGPGLLYAGAAVGVSHLIQSTRAGFEYGFAMILVVLMANIVKYPFFKAGPLYAITQGKSLLEAFNQRGRWSMALFYLVTVSAMFTVQAVVTLICASVLSSILNLSIELWKVSGIILASCSFILLVGKYKLLDRSMKGIILLLSITTIITLVAAVITYRTPILITPQFSFLENKDLFFLIALIGWMPAPLDISLWHSEWTLLASKKDTITEKESRTDFNIGYWGTTILAIAFVSLGALILRGNEPSLPESGVAFASQLLNMYASTIGDWCYIFIALAAFTTMFSTTLTVLDAYPRVLNKALNFTFTKHHVSYKLILLLLGIGALFVLIFQLKNMKQLVDFATTISFLTAPVLAILIYKEVKLTNSNIFNALDWWLAKIGIVLLVIFSLVYLFLVSGIF